MEGAEGSVKKHRKKMHKAPGVETCNAYASLAFENSYGVDDMTPVEMLGRRSRIKISNKLLAMKLILVGIFGDLITP